MLRQRVEPRTARWWVPGAVLPFILAGGIACGGSRTAEETAAGARPSLGGSLRGRDLVLLTVDTLRADRLGAYGYSVHPTSPRLDALLAEGVRFEQAMAARSSTWPSLATILSGRYPSGHGVLSNGYALPPELETLPKLLRRAGYQTGAFLGNMCQAGHDGWDAFQCSGGRDMRGVEQALSWLETTDPGRPVFLWLHLFGPHPPYYAGGERALALDPGYQGRLAPRRKPLDEVMTRGLRLDAADLRHLRALYDAAVMGTDELAGQFLDGVRSRGRLDRSLVVFGADHGEDLYEHHGYLYHACSVYQSGLHVPLAMWAPGVIAPGVVPQVVETVDVLPTTLDLLGVEAPPVLDGVSLRRYLERPGAGGPGRAAFSEYERTQIRTVLAGGFKLIDNPENVQPVCMDGVPPGFYPIEREELYDLVNDPGETRNLAAQEPARVAGLRTLLQRRFAAAGPARAQELSDELKKELQALGYVAQ